MSSIITRTLATAPGGYATATEVRQVSGLSSTQDISDSDLNEIILNATLRFIRDVSVRIDSAVLEVTDEARQTFRAPRGLIADQDGDADVDSNDFTLRFVKENDDGTITVTNPGAIAVNDSEFGVLTTAVALPDESEAILDYAHYLRPLELSGAKRAVRYLAAHMAYLRVKAPGRLTRADMTGLGADKDPRGFQHRDQRSKWLEHYRAEVARLTGLSLP